MEERILSEKESLELISCMIRNTQKRIVKKAGIPFIVFGYLTVLITVAVWFALSRTGNSNWNFLWYAIPVIGWPITMIFDKKYPKDVYTYVDRVVGYLWITCGVVCAGASILAVFFHISIMFIVLLVTGLGSAVTGFIMQFKPLIISGFISIIISFCCLIMQEYNSLQMLLLAIAFVVMMIIPGHIMNYKAGKQCLEN